MITKEHIDDYVLRNFPVVAEPFVEKAIEWAVEQMQPQFEVLQAENERLQKEVDKLRFALETATGAKFPQQ